MKPSFNISGGNTTKVDPTGPMVEKKKKVKTKAHWKKIAMEHGKNKSPESNTELITVGTKRGGKLISDEEEKVILQKRRCTTVNTNQIESEERSVIAAE